MPVKFKIDPESIFDAGQSLENYAQDATARIESLFANMSSYAAAGWVHRSPLQALGEAVKQNTEIIIANTVESGKKLQESSTILTNADREAQARIDKVLEELEY